MNLNKFTEKAQHAIVGAQQLAESLNHAQVEPEHLLVTLVEQPDGVVPALLRKMNIDPAEVSRAARANLPKARRHSAARRRPSRSGRAGRRPGPREATRLKDDFVSTEHLFVAIASEPAARRALACWANTAVRAIGFSKR